MSNRFFLLAILIMPIMLCSTVWQIGGPSYDYATIQLALDNGNVGHDDILEVYTGTYGPLKIGDKGVTIKADGSGPVYIEDQGENDHCIEFTNGCGSTTILEGLIIRNGNPSVNYENGYGGGIYGSGQDRAIIINDCEIKNNSGVVGAGIYLYGNNDRYPLHISDTIINNNSASGNGGGICLYNCNLNMQDVVFKDNSAVRGGGIYVCNVTISTSDTDRILINGNSTISNGGAIYIAGVNEILQLGSVTITNNTSTYGVGGIYVVYPNDVTLELVNSIIWDNDGTPQVPTGTDIEITYSDVEGLNGGTGNIDTDPEFELSSSYPLKYYSPCINKGNDDSAYDDPDGSRADMGWKSYKHDRYEWSNDASARVYLWKCFPNLPFNHNVYTLNKGWNIDVDEAWENWRPIPTSYFYAWYETTNPVVDGHDDNGWIWSNSNYPVCSQNGYKLQRTGTGDPLMFSRGLLCEDDVEFDLSPGENWIGYFLTSSQRVLDAFPSDVADDAIKIWTQNWCISRSTVNDPWTGTPASCILNYMDAVMITVAHDHTFPWETPAREDEFEHRPVAEHFCFVDEIDYQPIYVYFEEDDLPTEVAVYVNDVCKGAQVVEDTICQICAYILEEDEGEEIEFAFWYEGRGAEERKQSYQVFNQQTEVFESRSLITGMPGIHYEVSFKDHAEDIVPAEYYLSCYPNPFNPELTISFNLEETMEVKLSVFNIRGQKVKSLVNETFRSDDYNIIWNGENSKGNKVSSGVYYIRLQVGEDIVNRKVILMK